MKESREDRWLRREQAVHAYVIEMRVAVIEDRHAENLHDKELAHLKFINAVKRLRELGLGKGLPKDG